MDSVYKFSPGRIPAVQNREPADKKRRLDELFLELVRRARKAPYFARKFEGLDVNGIADIARLPVLTADEYTRNMYPYSNALLTTDGFPGGTVSRTGGTTSKPKYAVWGTLDKDAQIEASLPLLESSGLSEGDVVANMLHVGNLYSGLLSIEFEAFRMGLTSLALSVVSPETLVQVWRDFKFNAMVILPSSAMPVLRKAHELEPAFRVEKVVFGGTSMTAADRAWLHAALGVKRVASAIASNDGGPFGYQCEYMSGNAHHAMDEYSFVEIVDDDGKPVPDGAEGRILLTNLYKHAVPLIRYEIGDVGRLVPGRCACGRSDRRLEFLGRSKDSFILIGNTTNVSEVKSTLEPHGITELQIAIEQKDGVDQITIRFAAPVKIEAGALMGSLNERYGKLEAGHFVFEQVAMGELPRNPVSGKIVGLIYNRS